MKNFFIALSLAFLSVGIVSAASEYQESSGLTDGICVGNIYTSIGSTSAVCIDAAGTITPIRNLTNNIGSARVRWDTIYVNKTDAVNGLTGFTDMFTDLNAGSVSGALAAGFVISTRTLTALENSPTTYVAANVTQPPGAPRNITIYSSITASVGLGTTTLSGSATFYGINALGEYASENIKFSTNSVPVIDSTNTASNGTNQLAWSGIGNIAFATISSFTVQFTSVTAVLGVTFASEKVYVGYGNKIGLANNIVSSSDVYKVTQAGGTDVTNSSLLIKNTTYNTVIFPTAPSGSDEKKVWGRAPTVQP